MKSLFDVVNQLSSSGNYEWQECSGFYEPFMINRAFANFHDCIMMANEMNSMAISKTPKKWQYDFYHHAIKIRKKRFASWAKPKKDERIKIISLSYKCSKTVAEQYNLVLTDEDVQSLKERMDHGGR